MQPQSRLVIVLVVTAVLAGTVSGGPTRVALVPSSGDAHVGAIVALAEAELAQGGEVQLVERQQVDRIIGEQQLSLSGLMDADQAIKAGRVLSAQLIASIEAGKGSASLALVVFDASTGVRLWDETIAAAGDAERAEKIVRLVVAAAIKRQHLNTLRTVCLLAVRNADLPRGMDGFCDAVGQLLERNLVRSTGIVLLERSRLELVTRERALAEDAASRQLLASLVVVSVDVARQEQGLRAVAMLTDGSGKSLGTVTATAAGQDAGALVAALVAGVARDRNVPAPAGAADLAAEAARFNAEAEFRISHTDFLRAVPAAEAAHALDPGSARDAATLAEALLASARVVGHGRPPGAAAGLVPPPEQAAPLAARGARALAEAGKRFDAAAADERAAVDPILGEATDELCQCLIWSLVPKPNGPPGANVRADEFVSAARADLRRYLLDRDASRFASVHDAKTFDDYSKDFPQLLGDLEWACAADAGQWMADLLSLSRRWLAAHERFSGAYSAPVTSALEAIALGWAFEQHRFVQVFAFEQRLLRWDLSARDCQLLGELADAIAAKPHPAMRAFADACRLAIGVAKVQGKPDLMKDEVGRYLETVERQIASPQLRGRPDLRKLLYHLAMRADTFLDKTPWDGHYSKALFNFMLARHEVYWPIVQGRTGRKYKAPATDAEKAEAMAVQQRIIAVLDLPDCEVFPPQDKDSLRSACVNTIRLMNRSRKWSDQYDHVTAIAPWTERRPLVDVFDAKDGLQWVMAPAVWGDVIYAAGVYRKAGERSARVALLTIPIDGAPMKTGEALPVSFELYKEGSAELLDSTPTQMIMGSCVGGGYYCAATRREGLLLFPLDGGTPKRIDEQSGLPTPATRSVAILDGMLYAGLGLEQKEGYLIRYDFRTGAIDIPAASRRAERRSPFDDGSPPEMHFLVPDPPRHRLLAMIYRPEDQPALSGLWEYKPAADENAWHKLVPMRAPRPSDTTMKFIFSANPITYVGQFDGSLLPIATSEGIFLFDASSDRADKLYQRSRPNFDPPMPADMPRFAGETDEGERR